MVGTWESVDRWAVQEVVLVERHVLHCPVRALRGRHVELVALLVQVPAIANEHARLSPVRELRVQIQQRAVSLCQVIEGKASEWNQGRKVRLLPIARLPPCDHRPLLVGLADVLQE
eukprot:627454-Rhodomonas_salina.1